MDTQTTSLLRNKFRTEVGMHCSDEDVLSQMGKGSGPSACQKSTSSRLTLTDSCQSLHGIIPSVTLEEKRGRKCDIINVPTESQLFLDLREPHPSAHHARVQKS